MRSRGIAELHNASRVPMRFARVVATNLLLISVLQLRAALVVAMEPGYVFRIGTHRVPFKDVYMTTTPLTRISARNAAVFRVPNWNSGPAQAKGEI